MLKIKNIKIDGGTQSRDSLNNDIISEYALAMLDEVNFPPVTVFYDGTNYWLADGFHRIYASRKAGFDEIEADIKQGTLRDAILYSVGANSSHGLRRTNADKRRAVELLLNDEEWGKWSDREVARRCGVSNQFVSNIRPSVNGGQIEKKVERNGTVYTQNTANIGKKQESISEPEKGTEPIEIKNQEGESYEGIEQVFPTGQPAETQKEIEIDYTEELVFELFDTIIRRYQKLKDKEKIIFKKLLIEKLKEI